MFHSIDIAGYRGLETFRMTDLGRINLLVGSNNSGKTSVLEAIYLLQTSAQPSALATVMKRRGERIVAPGLSTSEPEYEVVHLFRGHDPGPEAAIAVSAQDATGKTVRSISLSFAPVSDYGSSPTLVVRGDPSPPVTSTPLSATGGLTAAGGFGRYPPRAFKSVRARFVGPESVNADELAGLWDQLVLTPTEVLVMQAMKFLNVDIERIAAQTRNFSGDQSRGGFIVKLRGTDQPVPIGSLGDGVWRMLALAISLSQCRGGVLLVDEIDTGLHYSAMARMWNLIYNAALELDVQVFATTHSYDCVYALAQIQAGELPEQRVTVQRIEAGKRRSVPYEQDELAAAALSEIEVR